MRKTELLGQVEFEFPKKRMSDFELPDEGNKTAGHVIDRLMNASFLPEPVIALDQIAAARACVADHCGASRDSVRCRCLDWEGPDAHPDCPGFQAAVLFVSIQRL